MKHAAVISFHTNPYTCGVARFNHSLAAAMGVKLESLDAYLADRHSTLVMLSIKLEEIAAETLDHLGASVADATREYDLLLHGTNGSVLERQLCSRARKVFAASSEIAEAIRPVRSDVVAVFAPGAPVLPRQIPVDCTLLTFGMAHKIRSEGYRRLATLLEGDARSFRLEISTALHEGGTFDESFFTVGSEISEAFAGNVRFLGFLADAEVSERLSQVDAIVAFFPRGVRENNTTVLSAMTHGCPVITNIDAGSPPWMVHGITVFDIARLSKFPDKTELRSVGEAGMRAASEFSFERLASIVSES